tara:strand:+ start:632 stop:886 length:255 start_codon:yes stop_codon:yes gene_type:complete
MPRLKLKTRQKCTMDFDECCRKRGGAIKTQMRYVHAMDGLMPFKVCKCGMTVFDPINEVCVYFPKKQLTDDLLERIAYFYNIDL